MLSLSVSVEAGRGQIRGFMCRSFAKSLQEQLGMEVVAERVTPVLAAWNESTVEPGQLGAGFLPTRWYRADFIHDVLDAVLGPVTKADLLELTAVLGRNAFREHMSGLQRAVFALFVSPDRVTKHAGKAWRHNFSSGELTYETFSNSHLSTYRNWREHHPVMCRAVMLGRLEIYGAMRLPDVRVKVLTCDPAHGCRSQVWWGPRGLDEPEQFDGEG